MRRPWPRFTVRRLATTTAFAAVGCLFGSGTASDNLSCHVCHNRRRLDSSLLMGLTVGRRQVAETAFPSTADHQHTWLRYSRGTTWLFGPKSRACRVNVYADGSTAPDGFK